MNETFIVIGCILANIAPLIVWASRFNLIGWCNIPFIGITIIPVFIFNFSAIYSSSTYDLYAILIFIDGLAVLLGVVLGFNFLPAPLAPRNPAWARLHGLQLLATKKRLINIIAFSCIGIAVSFAVMGFIPAFADDPFQAKFFKGQYQQPYDRIAFLFRAAQQASIIAIPLGLAYFAIHRNINIAFWLLLSFILAGLTLNRSSFGIGAIIVMLAYAAYKGRGIWLLAFVVYQLIFSLGSAIWYLLGLSGEDSLSLLEIIVSGSPDVSDQLQFLDAFSISSNWTYGRTFFGGLIPFRYEWNPSIYALQLVNSADVNDISSGGFRIPGSIWGYVSFGYIGAFLVPFVSSCMVGAGIKVFSRASRHGFLALVLAYVYVTKVIFSIAYFYVISIYIFPPLLIMYWLTMKPGSIIRYLRTINKTSKLKADQQAIT